MLSDSETTRRRIAEALIMAFLLSSDEVLHCRYSRHVSKLAGNITQVCYA